MNLKKIILFLNILLLFLFLMIRFSHYGNNGSDSLVEISLSNIQCYFTNNNTSELDKSIFIIFFPSIYLIISTILFLHNYRSKLIKFNTLFYIIYWLTITFMVYKSSIFNMKLYYISSVPFLVCWCILVYFLFLKKRKQLKP